ncbi:membrane protein [Deinococcus metalli]|uniref:Membrane protein n=1 Tax=Deinococcus metalli TaxID=1141878 RepID=A0ABQ3JVH0_9DEIO|nr:membrane protein [Deinococcus metalli]
MPLITAAFWVVKVLTTGMGETASDFLAHRLGPVPAVAITGLALLAALTWQLTSPRYRAPVYWTAVVMVSVFGTVAADVLHVGLGVPYLLSTIAFAAVLAAVFWLWKQREGTLSIHSIHTRSREQFYWATVLATFALGTAAGDLTARTLNLGWFVSALLFAALMLVPALLRRPLGEIATCWTAYVLTRPLGASVADWMATSHGQGGLNLGTGPVTLGWGALIVVFVAALALTRRDVEERATSPALDTALE